MRKLKVVSLFITTAVVASCGNFGRPAETNGNSVEVKNEVNVPVNLNRAYLDPAITDNASFVVTLPDENQILIGTDPKSVPKNELGARVKEYIDRQPADARRFYLKADSAISFAVLEEVLVALRNNKVEKINLVVSQSAKSDPSAVLPISLPERMPHENKNVISKPDPNTLIVFLAKDGRLKINMEDAGSISDPSLLTRRLAEVFKIRDDLAIFREGTNEIEKTVRVRPAAEAKYSEIAGTIDSLVGTGAAPIFVSLKDSKWEPLRSSAFPEFR